MGEMKGIGTAAMHIMDHTGDTKIMWNPRDDAEVDNARRSFEDLTDEGFRAFRVGPGGEAADRLESFDPAAEKIIMIPQMAGGCVSLTAKEMAQWRAYVDAEARVRAVRERRRARVERRVERQIEIARLVDSGWSDEVAATWYDAHHFALVA